MKKLLYRIILLILWPLMPLILVAVLLWEERHTMKHELQYDYTMWWKAFKKGKRMEDLSAYFR